MTGHSKGGGGDNRIEQGIDDRTERGHMAGQGRNYSSTGRAGMTGKRKGVSDRIEQGTDDRTER
jgi:hypothetical protein